MKKTNVAIVIDSLIVGGAQRMVCELIRNLDFREFDVSLHCFFGGSDKGFMQLVSGTPARVYLHGIGNRIDPPTLIRIYKSLSRERPDVVHAHLGGAQISIPWALMHHRNTLITLHSTLPAALNTSAQRMVRLAGENRVKLVAVSKENHRQACDYFGVEDSLIDEIDNGITLSDYSPCDIASAPTFINVATQNQNKNQMLILRAFKRLEMECPDARLILVGDGPLHEELCREAGDDPSIELPGALTNIPNVLRGANVYVQSSNREGMPMSILEAMACGLPVISTDVGGIRNVVSNSNGILIDAGSEDQLFRAMCELVDCKLRCKMGASSLANIDGYSAAHMARKYEKLYRELGHSAPF